MVRETRHVSLPAGDSELRLEGVAGGIVPQSALVEGLGDVVEKNRNSKLLSPGLLLDASLGKRVHLRRTSMATGAVREQDAVVLASGEGVVLQTPDGSRRCVARGSTKPRFRKRFPRHCPPNRRCPSVCARPAPSKGRSPLPI